MADLVQQSGLAPAAMMVQIIGSTLCFHAIPDGKLLTFFLELL
ncbi:hypothetical protein [Mesorhizobium sp. J8]|nr:hypothetical protein [Mesorhizobium sp. J8]